MSRDDDRRHLGEDFIWALRLVRLGYDEADIVKAISTRHPKYGYGSRIYHQTLERRGTEAARLYAVRTAQKALQITQDESRVVTPDKARERLQEIWARVDAEPWPLAVAGPRRALEAAFSIAFERGRVANMILDLRTHAMRAGQSLGAVRRNRIKLEELGWLRSGPRVNRRSSLVSFRCPEANIEETFLESSYVQEPALLAHDAFRPSALGDSGWSRFSYFARQPEIADEVREYLDLIALRHGSANAGYDEGKKFLEQRAHQEQRQEQARHANVRNAADIPCSGSRPMPRENAAVKGRRLLVEGRVTVRSVGEKEICASVRSDRPGCTTSSSTLPGWRCPWCSHPPVLARPGCSARGARTCWRWRRNRLLVSHPGVVTEAPLGPEYIRLVSGASSPHRPTLRTCPG